MLINIANKVGVPHEFKIFDTPLEICIERDSKREINKCVGEKIIRDYYNKFKSMRL
jgi:predicted kinase